MGCFGGCFRGLRKSCGEFGARLRRRVIRGQVVPQGKNDVAASASIHMQSSDPTVTSPSAMNEVGSLREVRTPEALNQVVEEFVGYELKKIKALGQIQDDAVAEELMARGATIDEINEAARKERKDEMPTVDI